MHSLGRLLRRRYLLALLAVLVAMQLPLALAGGGWAVVARLAAFALSLAVALAVLLRVRQQERQQRVLLEISQELTAQSELGELLDHIVTSIAELIPAAEKCVIHFLEPTGRRLYPRHVSQSGPGRMVGMPADSGIAGRALQRLETLRVDDVRREPGFLPLQSEPALRALLVAPLYVGRERLGTLSLNSSTPGAFGPHDEVLVSLLAAQASIALYQQQLQSRVSQERKQSELVLESLADALLVLDEEQRLLSYNPALATILGPDLSGLTGQRVQLQSADPRLQRLAYLVGDASVAASTRRRVSIEEPVHAVLEIDVTPVADDAGRRLWVVAMHDVTATADALATQTRLLRAAAHGLQGPLTALTEAATARARAQAAQRLERLRQDLLALSEPMEALALDGEAPVPLRAVLERLPAELAPELARKVRVEIQPGLELLRVRGRWLGHLLTHLVEQVWARGGEAGVELRAVAHPEEMVFTIIAPGATATRPWPHEELDALGFGADDGTLAMLVARRLAEALGGYLWLEQGGDEPRCQLILPLPARDRP